MLGAQLPVGLGGGRGAIPISIKKKSEIFLEGGHAQKVNLKNRKKK